MDQSITLPVTRCNAGEALIYLASTTPAMLSVDFQRVVKYFLCRLADDPDQVKGLSFYHSGKAFFVAPTSETPFQVTVAGNFFEGTMSAEAFGITASIFALGYVCEQLQDLDGCEQVHDAFHDLRHFACEHKEHALILRAID